MSSRKKRSQKESISPSDRQNRCSKLMQTVVRQRTEKHKITTRSSSKETVKKTRPFSASQPLDGTTTRLPRLQRPASAAPSLPTSQPAAPGARLRSRSGGVSFAVENAHCPAPSAAAEPNEKQSILKYMIHEVRSLRRKLDPNAVPLHGFPEPFRQHIKQ